MVRETLALYHPWGPTGWIIRRGYSWLSYGYCPCCYSSPPLPRCPICAGGRYGHELDLHTGREWAARWYERTTIWKGGVTRWSKKTDGRLRFVQCESQVPHGTHTWAKMTFTARHVEGYGVTQDPSWIDVECLGRGV